MTTRAKVFDPPKHHKRLWKEYTATTHEPARVAAVGDAKVAGFGDGFLPELHHRLYAETPREVPADERHGAAAVRAKLHDLAGELPEFATLRKQTVRSPMWAGMATAALGDSVARAVPASKDLPDADRAKAILDGLKSLEEADPEALASQVARAEGACDAATSKVEAAAAALDETAVRNALREGIVTAQAQIDEAEQALRAFGWGDESVSQNVHRSPAVALQLARRVNSSATLKRIIELAGRLIMTARAKRATKTEYARSEVVGVEPTNEVSRLLGSELALLDDEVMGDDVLIRLTERRALGYKMAGREKSAKGPIVVCIDQSGSMNDFGRDEWAKAIALAILDTARAEKRAFGIILYNYGVAVARLFPKPEEVAPSELLDILSSVPDGGTNYRPAIEQALTWIETSGTFKRADVIHITDGAASFDGAVEAKARAEKCGAHIFGIAIGFESPALQAWSHEVKAIRDVSSATPATDLLFEAL
jgi:uncharacterized protein with von Willebrand factor type A (vWA) domain